jgi:hypothetical protein
MAGRCGLRNPRLLAPVRARLGQPEMATNRRGTPDAAPSERSARATRRASQPSLAWAGASIPTPASNLGSHPSTSFAERISCAYSDSMTQPVRRLWLRVALKARLRRCCPVVRAAASSISDVGQLCQCHNVCVADAQGLLAVQATDHVSRVEEPQRRSSGSAAERCELLTLPSGRDRAQRPVPPCAFPPPTPRAGLQTLFAVPRK